MRRFVTAIAAIALVSSGALAQGNSGKGGDKGGGKPAAAQQGGGQGGGQGKGQGNDRAGKGGGQGGGGQSMAQSMRGGDNRGNSDAGREQRGNADRGNADRGNGQGAGRAADRVADNDRGRDNNDRAGNDRGRGNNDRTVIVDRRDGRFDDDRDVIRLSDLGSVRSRGLIDGCPPGLAKKNPPCVPPGLARSNDRLFGFDRPDWWGLSGLSSGRYYYDDGYLMRLGSDGRIGGFIPLLGGALGIGNAWPTFYEPVRLPGYYESYYDLGPYGGYRYADDVIYRVDPETAAITSIAALLTGDDFAIGQPMPLGYDVYNVPYRYRDQYIDRPDALYRYSDGYVYEVDPTTRLIAAAIELIA